MRLALFLSKRIARLVLTVVLIATIVFFVIRVIPGDPARVIAGVDSSPEEVSAIRERLGLNEPAPVQYAAFLWRALRFDFGESFLTGEPVASLLFARLPVTLGLAFLAFAFALLIAVPLGVLSAYKPWSVWDGIGMVFSQLGLALPGFWIGIMLLFLLSVRLPIFPLFGGDSFAHFVLPALSLALARAALLVRVIRGSTIEELSKEYILTARAKGLHGPRLVYSHALRNALLPVITLAGIQLGSMFGGAIIIEQVFSLPGVGRLFLSAIYQRDFPLVQGAVILVAVGFSLVNLLADMLYLVVNPRLRIS